VIGKLVSRIELECALETALRGGALMNEWPLDDRETVWLAEEQLEQLADLIAARHANTPIAPHASSCNCTWTCLGRASVEPPGVTGGTRVR
jgi:hypothetical protein